MIEAEAASSAVLHKDIKDIARRAKQWISSPAALDRMKNVMMGETKSKRHDLFLNNPSDSRLAELVNPNFLGVYEVLNIVTLQLRETVFTKFFQQADPRLKDMGVVNQFALASMYSLCVLFPETFIHQLEMQGKIREEAEVAYLGRLEDDLEEWISSPMAMDRMKNVMMGNTKSHRHNLFLDKRELEQINLGLLYCRIKNSRLWQLSNPNFFGDGNKHFTVVRKLNDAVLLKFLSHADPQLKKALDLDSPENLDMMYTILVLFPETFIHRFELTGMNREEAEEAFMEDAEDLRERFSKKFKAVVAVEDVAKKADEKTDPSMMKTEAEPSQVDKPLQESSDAVPSPSTSSPEQSKLASMGKVTEPTPEISFKDWIEKLEARVHNLRKRLEFLPKVISQVVVDMCLNSVLKVKWLDSWSETQIINQSYQYYQELESAIKEAQDVLQGLQHMMGERKQDLKDTRDEVELEEVVSIQQEFLQLLEQKETARKKLLTRNRSKLCWNCHSTENLLMCEDCMRAKYCSEECQEDDRENHEDWCVQMKQRRERRIKEKQNEK